MIEALRSTLDRHAVRVTPLPDPYTRVLGRRRRRRQRATVTVALAAVLLVVAPAVWLTNRPQPYLPVAGPPPAALLPLLDSPTRGSLAGDADFLDTIRRLAAAGFHGHPGAGDDGTPLPDDPAMVKVLFAGDIGTRRIAILAGLDGRPFEAHYQGEAGADPEELYRTGSGELTPVIDTGFASTDTDPSQTYLLLGPTGATYEQSAMSYTPDGQQRNWVPVDGADDYVALTDLRERRTFRIRVGDTVIYQTTAGSVAQAQIGRRVELDPQPVGGRGTPLPEAAQIVAGGLANATGLSTPQVTFRVLWSEEVDMPGTTSGRAHVVTVQAVLADGSGPFTTGAVDTGDRSYRDHPTGYGMAGDPAHTLIAMRLPHYGAAVGDRLQLIAPPTAVRAEVTSKTGVQEVTLVNGVGHLAVPPGAMPTIRAYDAADVLLATMNYVDLNGFGCDRFDPFGCPSPPPVLPAR